MMFVITIVLVMFSVNTRHVFTLSFVHCSRVCVYLDLC